MLESSAYIPADEIPPNSIFPTFVKVEPFVPKIPTAFLFCIVIVPVEVFVPVLSFV